jgi:2-polyprenyl-3-methyl-5-hydroxy-6-metoxy-1,4-benzoquinol methylase
VTLLRRAQGAAERMDEPDVHRGQLESALDHVAMVNRWLGARRALLRHVRWALPRSGRRPARVVDVGTGSADLPLAIADWAHVEGRGIDITALDRHAATLAVAARRTLARPEVRLARADALDLPFRPGTFDLALMSMTLHHMEGADLTGVLRELGRVAQGGAVLVCELERSAAHYLGARILAGTVWRGNPITRHDGPLSVRRSFTPRELRSLARDAGLGDPEVFRHPVFRLVLRARAA